MKFYEPKNLALLNAVIICTVYAVLFVISVAILYPGSLSELFTWALLAISSALLFLTTWFSFMYTLDRFIYSKIRLIYKSIHQVKVGKIERPVLHHDHGLIDSVQQEVEQWEEEKQREIGHLRQLEQYRREFIGNMSHELKTPLFNIQGYVSTLLEGGLEDPAINREYLKRTEKSIERLVRIIEDLDEISQLESGHIRLNVTRFDLSALTREVVDFLEMKAARHEIRITVNYPPKPVLVEADREKIRNVLTNIIDNSIRYGAKRHGSTEVNFFDLDENILTEITDNGVGIEPGDIPRVFERFYRTDRGRAVTRKGKGLGLAIVKHILEAHEQTIQVRSSIGVGTTFGFTLKKGS